MTAWPNGTRAITFAAIGVILLAARADQAYAAAVSFMVGTGLTATFAAIIAFAVLPNTETFVASSLVIGLVLVPAGAGMAQPWRTPMFTAMAAFFCILLAPTNQMSTTPSNLQRGIGDRRRTGRRGAVISLAAAVFAGIPDPPASRSFASGSAASGDGLDPTVAGWLGGTRL